MIKIFIFIFLFFLILNPYTIIGPVAYFLIIPFVIYSVLKYYKRFSKSILIGSLFLIFFSFVGVLSSYYHNIGQYVHLKVTLSLLIYLIVGFGLYFISDKNGLSLNDFIFLILLVLIYNSVLILFEVKFPVLRDYLEQYLAPSGNVDWKDGFRYRGLASGGGASLSILTPIGVTLALYLYNVKYIGLLVLVVLLCSLIASVMFVGRTGIFILPVVFLMFFFFNIKKYLARSLVFLAVFLFAVITFFDFLKEFMIEQYGIGFYNYSIGFIFNGASGIEDEGTVGVLRDFITVMPVSFPEVLLGYGFYGGSEFIPWTDSGLSRMFLSVGYLFGALFYITFLLMSYPAIRYKAFLFLTMIVVLSISELKEPLLFTGYASRVYFLILAFSILEQKFQEKQSDFRYVTGRNSRRLRSNI